MQYRELTEKEIQQAQKLAWNVFSKYEAPEYSEQGIQEFHKTIHDHQYLSTLQWYGAFTEDSLAGIIALRNKGKHIALYFVEEKHQKKGVGKKLFNLALECSQEETITVNSSPYAVPVYQHLGFHATEKEQITNGIRYTPMIYKKPPV